MAKNFSFPASVLQPIRDYLMSRQQKLEKRRQDLSAEDPFTDTERVDDNASLDTDAAEISGHDRVMALKHEVDKGLIEIRKTLTRIKLGKYGLCSNCGRMIDTDRLSLEPTAELCVVCQREKQGKK